MTMVRYTSGVRAVEKGTEGASNLSPNFRFGKITIEEREQLGRGEATEATFLDAVQNAITGMVRRGIKKPAQQAGRLNAAGLKPFHGCWTPRLVVKFYQRQDERRRARAALERARLECAVAATDPLGSAVHQVATNPVLSDKVSRAVLAKLREFP